MAFFIVVERNAEGELRVWKRNRRTELQAQGINLGANSEIIFEEKA